MVNLELQRTRAAALRRAAGRLGGAAALVIAAPADASLFTGDTLDAVADGMSWVVLAIVPLIAIVVFWLVHVMPEKIAHKRHHPQTQAIQTLCLLSLVFGGMLWPIAWLWAYTRPVAYKVAFGTDKHEDYFTEAAASARDGTLLAEEVSALRRELDVIAERGGLTAELAQLREDLARLDAQPARVAATQP